MNETVKAETSPLITRLLGVTLKTPVIAASGTFGFGREYSRIIDTDLIGGISGKGLTLNGSSGNSGRRLCETPSGLLNSIGLENPGVRHFIEHDVKTLRSTGAAVICNLGGHSVEDYTEGTRLLNDADIDILELNISCPNVKCGGMTFGTDPATAADLVSKVKAITRHPLLVKLSPNAPDIVAVARACEEAGADGLSLINTVLGMAIDIKAKRPVFKNTYAGLSGPAVKPIALRMTHQVAHSVNIPIVGMGGISSAEDAIEFIMAGAAAVQVGTATFVNPETILNITRGLLDYCNRNKLKNISEICGIV